MTEGQELALQQLREVAKFGARALEIVESKSGAGTGSSLTIDLSLQTGHLPRVEDGLPLRERERFLISVPPDFPFSHPAVVTRHTRFAGFPHVQWGRHLCLYQAPGTEWDPSDGLFGFLVRLEEWLAQGALNELDSIGAPLHPPAVYAEHDQMVIPRVDTPVVGDAHWYGLARLKIVSDRRIDVIGWLPSFGEEVIPPVAAALLLSSPMPWEFPQTVATMIRLLEARGVSRARLLLTLQFAVLRNQEEAPLYVLIGAPMRGIRGSGELRQHLSAWYVEPFLAKALRLAVEKYSDHGRLQEIGAEIEGLVWKWAEEAAVSWCTVREDRPEIVTRRDHAAPTAPVKDKTVALWGCGALGSHIAEFLIRAGIRKLVLRDKGKVAHGLLVRQQFDDADVGEYKAVALAKRLGRIREDVAIEALTDDLVAGPLSAEKWNDGADLVIDSTGSRSVLKKLERQWFGASAERTAVASLVIGPDAERALAVVVRPEYAGGPLDAVRRAKLAACEDEKLSHFQNEFWPDVRRQSKRLFQPEPGCSDPTFVGSAADLAVLAGSMLSFVAHDLAQAEPSAFAHFVTRPDVDIAPEQTPTASYRWSAEKTVRDALRGYDIRISDAAWQNMLAAIEKSRRRRGSLVETGGLLLGERDDAARVIWITDATDPPPDSRASRYSFVCGTDGSRELDARRRVETLGAVRFVGMWHTHPQAAPRPSDIDLDGMAQLVTSFDPPIARSLLLIVGNTPTNPTPAAYLFTRDDFVSVPMVAVPWSVTDRSWAWLAELLRRWTHRVSLPGRRTQPERK